MVNAMQRRMARWRHRAKASNCSLNVPRGPVVFDGASCFFVPGYNPGMRHGDERETSDVGRSAGGWGVSGDRTPWLAVAVASLGYFVDLYDLVVFSVEIGRAHV